MINDVLVNGNKHFTVKRGIFRKAIWRCASIASYLSGTLIFGGLETWAWKRGVTSEERYNGSAGGVGYGAIVDWRMASEEYLFWVGEFGTFCITCRVTEVLAVDTKWVLLSFFDVSNFEWQWSLPHLKASWFHKTIRGSMVEIIAVEKHWVVPLAR
ncbi:hypothetical protein TNCV_291711, partial [Trichonephila clavipes]